MADYRRAGDAQVIEQANQIGNRMSDLGMFIGRQNIAQQEQDRLQAQLKGQFLKEGVNPDASGLTPYGQSQQDTQVATNQYTQAGMNPNSSRSQTMADYIGKISGQSAPVGIGANDIEKVQPAIDTAQKTQAELTRQQSSIDAEKQAQIQQTSEAERLANTYKSPNGKAKVSVGKNSTSIEEASPNPMALTGHLNKEASDARTFVNKSLAPIKDGLDAGTNSLNLMQNGDEASLNAALVNEAKALGGPRAVATIVKMLDPNNTIPGLAAKIGNVLTGQGKMTFTPDMINNMRKATITRMNGYQQQLQSLRPQLSKQIELQANLSKQMGTLGQIQDTAFQDMDALSGRAKQMAHDYMEAQAAAQDQKKATMSNTQGVYSPAQSPVSQIGNSLVNGLSKFIGAGPKSAAPQQSSPAPQQSGGAPMSFEEFKRRKAAGTL